MSKNRSEEWQCCDGVEGRHQFNNMAAAGPPVAKFSNLFGQADLWDSPDVAMNPTCTIFGAASTANQNEARAAFMNFACRTALLAF